MRATVRATTHDSYSRLLRQHVLAHVAQIPLQKLDGAALNRMYASLLVNGRKNGKGGLSPRTVRYAHVVLHRGLRDAVKWNRLIRNPADQADPPKVPTADMRTWTSEHVGRFLSHVRDERLYALWVLAANTGMRRSELLGLRWSDVSWDPPRVEVTRTLVSVGYKLHFGEPKTSRGRRSIRLDDQTAAALRAWRVQQAEEKLANGDVYRDGGLVFSSPVGEPIHPDRMSQMFERHAKRAGLPAIPLHGLRHAHASVLRAGVNPRVVQQRLGHSSVAFTLNVYSHVVPELEAEAAEKAAALVFRS